MVGWVSFSAFQLWFTSSNYVDASIRDDTVNLASYIFSCVSHLLAFWRNFLDSVFSVGQPGVEFSGQHEEDVQVTQMYWIPEQVSNNDASRKKFRTAPRGRYRDRAKGAHFTEKVLQLGHILRSSAPAGNILRKKCPGWGKFYGAMAAGALWKKCHNSGKVCGKCAARCEIPTRFLPHLFSWPSPFKSLYPPLAPQQI